MSDQEETSPVPQIVGSEHSMSFPDAISQIIEGKKVTRLEWNNGEYGFLNGDTLSLHKEDDVNYQWIVKDGDLLAKDWVIINV